ncbi:MAG: hypothetical protein Q8K72_01025 [Acidimicrobiales bacterium]|nr:hypothetical protein [Acidimicrobiales bacterium]
MEGIEAVSSGGRYWDAELHRVGRTQLTVSSFFRGSELASHVAGAIASGRAHDWADVANLTGYSLHSVQKASELFGDALYQMGEVDDATRVRQATIFRWCGEHSRYILSWCRRNGLGMYRRSLTTRTS